MPERAEHVPNDFENTIGSRLQPWAASANAGQLESPRSGGFETRPYAINNR
jgi:hypothetical protein